jgi:hypothetical protein
LPQTRRALFPQAEAPKSSPKRKEPEPEEEAAAEQPNPKDNETPAAKSPKKTRGSRSK